MFARTHLRFESWSHSLPALSSLGLIQPMNAASWLEGLPPPDKWRTLVLTHGPRIATWVLAFALAVQAAVIVTNLAGSSRPPKVAPATLMQSHTQSVHVAAIVDAHLFGFTPIAPVQQDAANAPHDSLPLALV